MAGRPPKQGIDFAAWDTDMFEDIKIQKLLDAQGWHGFAIYFFICQDIAYRLNGYFYRWSCSDSAVFIARKMGGGIGSEQVNETVRICLQIALFDKGTFDRWNVITSKGIQRGFSTVLKNRKIKEVISELWLLEENENPEGLVKVANCTEQTGICMAQIGVMTGANGHYFDSNSNSDSNSKKVKVKDVCPEPSPDGETPSRKSSEDILTVFLLKDKSEYFILKSDVENYKDKFPAVDVEQEFQNMGAWLIANPAKRKTKSGTPKFITSWLIREQQKSSAKKQYVDPYEQFLKRLDDKHE
jgi:hypothetical protein